jgi:hypothetical protein
MGMNYCKKCDQDYIDWSFICPRCHTEEECWAAARPFWVVVGVVSMLVYLSPVLFLIFVLLDWLLK